jgi:hypothetical protein
MCGVSRRDWLKKTFTSGALALKSDGSVFSLSRLVKRKAAFGVAGYSRAGGANYCHCVCEKNCNVCKLGHCGVRGVEQFAVVPSCSVSTQADSHTRLKYVTLVSENNLAPNVRSKGTTSFISGREAVLSLKSPSPTRSPKNREF